jgi:hypothetical protein
MQKKSTIGLIALLGISLFLLGCSDDSCFVATVSLAIVAT